MKMILATNNRHKVQEISRILDGKFQLLTLSEAGIDVEVEETGTTLYENALLKASTIGKMSGCIALADDTGLMVDYLDGAPGIYSARYAGIEHDDRANRALLLANLKGVPHHERTAHFGCCIVVYFPDGHHVVANGRVDGYILDHEEGEGGFGYDSLFWSSELNKTFASATPDEKNSVSHRGRALADLLTKL